MIQSLTDEDDNVPLAQLAAQLHRSTTLKPFIEIEELIGIDDNVERPTLYGPLNVVISGFDCSFKIGCLICFYFTQLVHNFFLS